MPLVLSLPKDQMTIFYKSRFRDPLRGAQRLPVVSFKLTLRGDDFVVNEGDFHVGRIGMVSVGRAGDDPERAAGLRIRRVAKDCFHFSSSHAVVDFLEVVLGEARAGC